MEQEQEKGRGGRPSTGDKYPRKLFGFTDDRGMGLVDELRRRRGGVSRAALLRMLVLEEARRQGLVGDDEGAE